jgi:hypothetical protein
MDAVFGSPWAQTTPYGFVMPANLAISVHNQIRDMIYGGFKDRATVTSENGFRL